MQVFSKNLNILCQVKKEENSNKKKNLESPF